jgi:hypothetical protein
MDLKLVADNLWKASNVWMEFRNQNLNRSSLYKAGKTLVSKTKDTKERDSYAFMRLPVPGDPVIHLSKERRSGWQILGVSSVIRKFEERKDPQNGQDLYVIALKSYGLIPPVSLESIIWEAEAKIGQELKERRNLPFPAYYPFVEKRKFRSPIAPAERYLSLATRTIIQALLLELGGEWKEWGIDPEFTEHDAKDLDIRNILEAASTKRNGTPTEVNQLIDARRGQGKFRSHLDKLWGNKCAVLGLATRELLKASHIKPWVTSSDSERLNPENGILLSANLDVLFDSFLISFSDNGKILISNRIGSEDRQLLKLEDFRLSRLPSKTMKTFLAFHRGEAGLREGE